MYQKIAFEGNIGYRECMKKLLPFAPLLTLIVGSIVVQTTQAPLGLLSSIINPDSSPELSSICTKPAQFSRE